MKRALFTLLAVLAACALLGCGRRAPAPTQSAFMQAVNEELTSASYPGALLYLEGVQESEALCKLAQQAAEVTSNAERTDRLEGDALKAAQEHNILCIREQLNHSRQLKKQGLSLKYCTVYEKDLSPTALANLLLQQAEAAAEIGWHRADLPCIDGKGNWDGTTEDTIFVVFATTATAPIVVEAEPAETNVEADGAASEAAADSTADLTVPAAEK